MAAWCAEQGTALTHCRSRAAPAQLLSPQLSTMDRNPFGAAEGEAWLCILDHTTKVCWLSSTGYKPIIVVQLPSQQCQVCLSVLGALLWKPWGENIPQLSTALRPCLGSAALGKGSSGKQLLPAVGN